LGRRNRRSRTRSSTSAASRPKLPPIFLDENLAGKRLPEGLRKDGLAVKLLHEEFQRGVLDTDLLPRIGEKGWILLTKDNQIRRRPLEIQAFIAARLRVLVFESAEMTSGEMLDAFRKALPAIGQFVKKRKAPFVMRVGMTGRVTALWPERKRR
jgi:PIN like domain